MFPINLLNFMYFVRLKLLYEFGKSKKASGATFPYG